MLFGFDIITSTYWCQYEFVRWRKNHRKSRINKKWHKKYGNITACKGHAYRAGTTMLYACPHFIEHLKKGLGDGYQSAIRHHSNDHKEQT